MKNLRFLLTLGLIPSAVCTGIVSLAKNNNRVNHNQANAITGDTNEFNDGRFVYTPTSGTATVLNSTQMASEGIAAGYTGDVLKIGPNNSPTGTFDFSCGNYLVDDMSSITFRIYAVSTVSGNKPEFRIQQKDETTTWRLVGSGEYAGDGGLSLKNHTNEWLDLEISPQVFAGSTTWATFADATDNTKLGILKFTFRTADAATLYIDSITVHTNGPKISDFTNNHQFSVSGAQLSGNGYPSSPQVLDASEASAAGVPSGYTGTVLYAQTTTAGGTGVTFDYTASKIPTSQVESITVRYYLHSEGTNTSYPQVRLFGETTSNIQIIGSGSSNGFCIYDKLDQWNDLVIGESTFNSGKSFGSLCSSTDSSILGKFNLHFRTADTSTSTVKLYIDSVILKLDTTVSDFTHDEYTYSAVAGKADLLKESDVDNEGITTGYTGSVLKVYSNGSSDQVDLDFKDANIKICLIDSISFRVLASGTPSGKKPEFRIQELNTGAGGWSFFPASSSDPLYGDGGYALGGAMNTWHDLSLDNTTIKPRGSGFTVFADTTDPTRLGKFRINFRVAGSDNCLYIDDIKVNLKPNDGVAPVITYSGEDTITVHAEQSVKVNATAYDAQEDRNVDIEYVWDKNAQVHDNNKVSNQGTFSLTLKAADYYTNSSTKELTVIVIEQDTEAPVIDIKSSLTIKAGTKASQIDISSRISDNSGQFTYNYSYSAGTLSNDNRFILGTHTLTINAVDYSENETTLVVTLNVTALGQVDETIINEDDTYTFVVNFVNNYMHMDYTSNLGYCSDSEHHYYATAKAAYNDLSDESKEVFNTASEFNDAKARLLAWANANGDTIDSNYDIVSINSSRNTLVNDNNNYLIIIIASVATLFSISAIFLTKKRKHNV